MWWPAIGGCYVGALGSRLFDTLTFVYYITSVNGFADLQAILISELGYHVVIHLSELNYVCMYACTEFV